MRYSRADDNQLGLPEGGKAVLTELQDDPHLPQCLRGRAKLAFGGCIADNHRGTSSLKEVRSGHPGFAETDDDNFFFSKLHSDPLNNRVQSGRSVFPGRRAGPGKKRGGQDLA